MKPSKNQLFKRQISVSEIGELGQEKLQKASVLVVGCGGLGSVVAVYLAASGIGKIHLVDFDTVDISNLHRQVFYSMDDIGKPKASTLANIIKQRAPFTDVNFSNKAVTKKNVFELILANDVVVDGTDSLPTKYLLNDACVLKNKPLVYGSMYKFDGYVASFHLPQLNGFYSANLRDAFPEIGTDIPNCETVGTLNAIVGMIATAQVNEVLKIFTGVGKPLQNELLIYNSLQNSQLKMQLKPTFSKEKIQKIFDSESYFDVNCKFQNSDWLISNSELKEKLSDSNLKIIAVLPNLKLPFLVSQTIPIHEFSIDKIKIDLSKTYIMVCQKGLNSYKATSILKNHFPDLNVFSLAGGIENYQ